MSDRISAFLSQSDCADLRNRLDRITRGRGITTVNIQSRWHNQIRWARNRVLLLEDTQNTMLDINRSGFANNVGTGSVGINQIDDVSLRSALRYAESSQAMGLQSSRLPMLTDSITDDYPATAIWSDRTYRQAVEERVALVRELTDATELAGVLSAGDISVAAVGFAAYATSRPLLYAPKTEVRCSITVRDPDRFGSGWAGRSSYDWYRFDAHEVAAIALDKCLRSRDPVRIEPGRYTTILEPQATYDLLFPQFLDHAASDIMHLEPESSRPNYPFFERPDEVDSDRGGGRIGGEGKFRVANTKLGQRIGDQRFRVSFTPDDPDLGVIPWVNRTNWAPVRAATWFDGGVLTQLEHRPSEYREGSNGGAAYRMDGGETSVNEMVATTNRGLLVTRFYGVTTVDKRSILLSGVTRDGLWLIERGKITKPLKNLRFTESPLVALNNVLQLGQPTPIFTNFGPAIVPAMKIQDFSFTSVTDAV